MTTFDEFLDLLTWDHDPPPKMLPSIINLYQISMRLDWIHLSEDEEDTLYNWDESASVPGLIAALEMKGEITFTRSSYLLKNLGAVRNEQKIIHSGFEKADVLAKEFRTAYNMQIEDGVESKLFGFLTQDIGCYYLSTRPMSNALYGEVARHMYTTVGKVIAYRDLVDHYEVCLGPVFPCK